MKRIRSGHSRPAEAKRHPPNKVVRAHLEAATRGPAGQVRFVQPAMIPMTNYPSRVMRGGPKATTIKTAVTDRSGVAAGAVLQEDYMTATDKPAKVGTATGSSAPGVVVEDGRPSSIETRFLEIVEDFNDNSQEWRRLFSELLGTFFLVLVAAGGGMMGQAFPNTIGRTAAVVAPGLMVMAIILFMGKISGAHLNPAVSFAFALRGDFPWARVPGYIVVQLIGASLAAWFLQGVIKVSSSYGSNYPAPNYSSTSALLMEIVLTLGLVSVILGTASGAQNLGVIGALGVGSYIALAGLWGSPISGTSMNPSRTFGPDLVSADFSSYWVYVAGPVVGAALAVGIAFILRGRGGGRSGSGAAQGALFTQVANPNAGTAM